MRSIPGARRTTSRSGTGRRVHLGRPHRPEVARSRGRGRERRLPSGCDGRARRRLRRRRRLRPPQRPGDRATPRARCTRAAFAGRIVLASSMVVYGEGAIGAPSTESCDPRHVCRHAGRGALRAAVPAVLRPALAADRSPRTACPTRGTSTPRRSCIRSICAERSHGSTTASTVTALALPQRLRTADAARHAVRRSREHLPQRARSAATHPRSSRTAASAATSSTCETSPARTSARYGRSAFRRTGQRRQRRSAHRARHGNRHRRRRRLRRAAAGRHR